MPRDVQWFRYRPRFQVGQRVRDFVDSGEGVIKEVLERPHSIADYIWQRDDGTEQLSSESELEET